MLTRAGRRPRLGAPRRLPAADALFLDVDTAEVPQQIGTVIELDVHAAGPLPRDLVVEFARAIPRVAGCLQPTTRWRGARWRPLPPEVVDRIVDVGDVRDVRASRSTTDAVRLDSAVTGAELVEQAADEFFGEPLDLSGPAARVRLLTGLPGGREALLVKVHHALCDGVALTTALLKRLEELGDGGRAPDHSGSATRPGPAERRRLRSWGRGLWSLARAGRAPRSGLDDPPHSGLDDPARDRSPRHVLVDLPRSRVRRAARRHHASTGEVLIALLADALSTVVPDVGGAVGSLRVMVPRTLRAGGEPVAEGGNRTGAMPVDLPIGAMPFDRRLRTVRDTLRRQTSAGQPQAAHLVVAAACVLPPGVRRWVNRRVYRSTWFTAIVTVLPGIGGRVELCGRRAVRVYPVVPLAPGVNLAFGAMTGRDVVCAELTLGPCAAPFATALSAALREALERADDERDGSTGATAGAPADPQAGDLPAQDTPA